MSEVVTLLDDVAMSLLDANGSTDADLNHIESQLHKLARLVDSIDPRCADALQKSAILLARDPSDHLHLQDDPLLVALKAVAAVQLVVRRESTWEEAGVPSILAEDIRKPAPKDSKPTCSVEVLRSVEIPTPTPLLDPDLLEGFVLEAQEHLETVDVQLMALESSPTNQEGLSAVFRAFHTIKGVAGFMGLHSINAVAHEAENLLVLARDGKKLLTGPTIDCIFAAADMLKRLIHSLSCKDVPEEDPELARTISSLIETLKNVSSLTPDQAQQGLREITGSESATSIPTRDSGTDSFEKSTTPSGQPETLRVDRERLDCLVDMIGELVIAEAMVQQDLHASNYEDVSVGRNLAQLNKITRNLQELSLSLRMVPIRATFQKMARMVRDLSKKLGKPIDFHMVGEDTELDKTVVDQIGDPLMHMVRNAVDHGIESSQELRVQAGKTANGNVTLRAFHQGGNIYIEIQDDGRGLDPERLRNKARERGIIGPDATLSDRELMQLIFHPGFSTAEKVTDVSGRGVGMDVVRRNIEALRGSVDLRSDTGRGTCISMRLPLTLAIIDGMVVSVGQNRYIIPTLSIVELLRPKPNTIATFTGRGEYFTILDSQLPLMRVGQLLCNQSEISDPSEGIVVVVEDGHFKAGLLVDAVHGQQQAVIKSLGHRLEGQKGVAGGAVMPDGRVGLILDVHGLLELAGPNSSAVSS